MTAKPPTTEPAVRCTGVTRDFGSTRALDDVSLEVAPGEIFGVIGPNGAGKTTLLNCLEGLDSPTSGHVSVLGLDPVREQRSLVARIGVQLQSAALPPHLDVRDALELYSGLYPHPQPWRPLLETLGIAGKAKDRVDKLSGGERQRVFIALALLHRPELVFLDELTTALDPQSRRAMWDVVSDIRQQGTTVVLTTHYMEEAEHLCDRVAIIDRGRLVALDTVPALIAAHAGSARATITCERTPTDDLALESVPGVLSTHLDGPVLTVRGEGGFLQPVLARLSERGITVTGTDQTRPDLEDVFLALTGRPLHHEEEPS